MDKILERLNLNYSDLSSAERETLHSWMQSLETNELTIEKIRDYILAMRDAVEQELSKTEHNSKQDIFLKARLRNYMLLECFLSTPERAKRAIELQLSSIQRKI